MKTYSVEIVETRSVTILVKADDWDSAFDKAEELHQTSDDLVSLLNEPTSCTDTSVHVIEETTPFEGEKVW